MSGNQLRPEPWTAQPIRVINIHGNHLFVCGGRNVLVWSLATPDKNAITVTPFTEEGTITSISCLSINNNMNEKEDFDVVVFVTSFYCYRKFLLNFSTGKVKFYSEIEGRYGEILIGHLLESTGMLVYDLNNYAVVHGSSGISDKSVRVFKGQIGAPDSVSVYGSHWEEIVIFVATSSSVFICNLVTKDREIGEVEPIYVFSQTKGVIFSINYYPKSSLIVTSSDDRSISLWNCHLYRDQVSEKQDNLYTIKNPIGGVIVTLKAQLEGHTSRLFNAILAGNGIVSVGEDSNVVFWPMDETIPHHIIGNHSGSTVWSCVYSEELSKIYTCADNGSVLSWDLCKKYPYELGESQLFPGWINSNNSEGVCVKDFPRLVKCWDHEKFVITTNCGRVMIVNNEKVFYSMYDLTWKSYLTIALSLEKEYYVTGNITGLLSFNTMSNLEDGQPVVEEKFQLELPEPEKVMSIHFLCHSELLVSTTASLLKYNLQQCDTTKLPHISLAWNTKQNSNVNCVEKLGNVIYLGFDNGKIKAYNRRNGYKLHEFKIRHSKFGVGGIVVYNDTLVTGGRDSKLNFFFIDKNLGEESYIESEPVTHLKTVPLSFLWVGSFHKYKDDLLVCGFESSDFIIYSWKREQIIGRMNCGGAHRSWDFQVSENGTGTFTHIRSGKAYKHYVEVDQYITNCVKEGFHLDDINSVVEIPNSSDKFVLIATGGEDCSVKISIYTIQNLSGSLKNFKPAFVKDRTETVCTHSSAVRCLHYQPIVENLEGYLLSGGGKSELFLIKLYLEGNSLKKYQTIKRITFERQLDFRIMDITSFTDESSTLFAFAACSDGNVRIVRENSNHRFPDSFLKASGTNHCLNTVNLINPVNSSEVNIVCGTSAGEIVQWKFSLEKNCWKSNLENDDTIIHVHRVINLNVMSITSLAVYSNSSITLLLIGEDDGSLSQISMDLFNSGHDEEFVLIQKKVTNDGILGLQIEKHHDRIELLRFISGGKLYFCNKSLDEISYVSLPILDGKGITICTPLKFFDISYTPFVNYGKGLSLFTM